MRHHWFAALVGGALLALVAGAGSATARPDGGRQGDPIKIGAMSILSGPTAVIGQETMRGTLFEAERINRAGGVLGRRIQIIQGDDQNNPAVAVQVAARLIQSDRVTMIVGPTATAPGVAILKLQADNKIPGVAYQSGGEALTAAKSPWIQRSSVTLEEGFHGTVAYARRNLRVRDFAFLGWNLQSGQSALKGTRVGIQQFGGRLVYEQSVPLTTADFSSAIAQARARNPQAVVIGGPMPLAGVIVKQIRAANWNVRILAWGGFVTTDFLQFIGREGEGTYLGDTSHWRRVITRTKGEAFVDAFRRRFGRPPNPNELVGADALGIAVNAIRRARSTDGERIMRVLRRPYNGIRLFYQWTEDGNVKRHPIVMTRIRNGQPQLVSSDVFGDLRKKAKKAK
jgi:branched-chain amino acid transport system substrate-binding protein